MNEWRELERCRPMLTRQQYKTIKGQLRAGDTAGAMRGLRKLTGGELPSQGKRKRPAPPSRGSAANMQSG
nr:MAG TPA: hypothetical protein [Caudoviricetes sp.]